jgi:hypothetical protein
MNTSPSRQPKPTGFALLVRFAASDRAVEGVDYYVTFAEVQE